MAVRMDKLKKQFMSAGWSYEEIPNENIIRFTTERMRVDFILNDEKRPITLNVYETKLHTNETNLVVSQDLSEYNYRSKSQVVFGGRTIKLSKTIDLLWDNGRKRGRIK